MCIQWPKDWSFSFSISPSSEYPGLISFGTDWFDVLAIQRTLKSLLQDLSLEASVRKLIILQFVYLYFVALGLRCQARAFSSCGKWGLVFLPLRGLLTAAASLMERGL